MSRRRLQPSFPFLSQKLSTAGGITQACNLGHHGVLISTAAGCSIPLWSRHLLIHALCLRPKIPPFSSTPFSVPTSCSKKMTWLPTSLRKFGLSEVISFWHLFTAFTLSCLHTHLIFLPLVQGCKTASLPTSSSFLLSYPLSHYVLNLSSMPKPFPSLKPLSWPHDTFLLLSCLSLPLLNSRSQRVMQIHIIHFSIT